VSDSNRPGDVPDDLPPEYADAYRRGYQRAVDEETQAMPAPTRGEPAGGQRRGAHRGPEADSGYDTQPASAVDWGYGAQRGPAAEPEHTSRLNLNDVLAMQEAEAGAERYDAGPADGDERERRKRSLYVPTLLVALAVLLLASAYVFGKIFSSEVTGRPTGANTGNLVMKEHDGGSGSPNNKPSSKHSKQKYDGPVNAAPIGAANASCQSPTSADAAGNAVEYNPENVYDGDMTTAWRCDGDGYGERLSLALPQQAALGEVGLVPGYAKTDPYSHADRYAENNRITKVQWSFSDGSSVIQRFDPSPSNREMQVMRIPVTRSDRVTISILDSQPGPRNTVAISEVTLGQVAR
jgi:hypothetical protein